MIGGLLPYGTRQLCHFRFLGPTTLKACEHDFPLPGLEAVHQTGNGSFVVHIGKEDQLLVDEIRVGDGTRVLCVQVVFRQP